jgi:outer membrane immunogenic protein
MMSRLSSVAALLTVLAAPAYAADLAPQGGFTDTYDWSGFYLGINGGFGWQDNTIDYSYTGSIPTYFTDPVGFLPTTVTNSASGAQGGMQIGYNVQAGSFVYGLEADAIAFTGKGTGSFTATDTLFSTFGQSISASTTTETPWAGSLRARFGFTDDRFLGYVTAGVAIGRTETQSNVSYFADSIFFTPPSLYSWSTSESSVNIGWAAGAGIEYAFASNVIARVEYMYYDLGNTSVTLPDASFSGFSGAVQQSNSINTLRIGLGYKFQ